MKISVVMAVYNGEKYIEEQLMSILSQSIMPDELIIQDDGSSDSTTDKIQSITEKSDVSVKLIKNKENLGFSKNFITAISAASGEYIFLSDQDDIWKKDRIKRALSVMEDNDNILALSSAFDLIDEDGVVIKKAKNSKKLVNISQKEFIKHPKFPGMAMVFKKELWEYLQHNGKVDWESGIAHDWAINYVALKKHGMYKLEESLICYRQHSSNTFGTAMAGGFNQKDKRIKLIKSLMDNARGIKAESQSEEKLLEGIVSFNEKRIHFYEHDRLLRLLLHEFAHMKYISLRSIMGDIYTNLRGRNR